MVRLIGKGLLGAIVSASLAAAAAGPACAQTPAPWWGLTSGSQPTNLVPGAASDERQQLTVDATGGEFALVVEEGGSERFRFLPWNASAAAVQTGLEEMYPNRKVEVSGGPGGTNPYLISFPGQTVKSLFVFGFLSGGKAEARLEELSHGKPDGQIVVTAENLGDAAGSAGATIADKLPAGLRAVAIEGHAGGSGGDERGPVACSLQSLTCASSEQLPEYEVMEMRISVVLQAGASSGEQNTASISGGGGASVTTEHAIEVGGEEKFGIEDYRLIPENVGGSLDTQAGSHPFQLTSTITLNRQTPDGSGNPRAVRLQKDIVAELPPGLIGNPTPFTQCTDEQFNSHIPETDGFNNECPAQSTVGVAVTSFNEPLVVGASTAVDPIFNMKPLAGEPARFGFLASGALPVFLDTSVRTGGDYGVTVTASNITQLAWLYGVRLTFWGVPGDPRHDPQRGWECLEHFGTCTPSTATAPPPFLQLPSSCEKPYESTLNGDSWPAPGLASQQAQPVTYRLPEALDGCNHLPFDPSITVAPDVPDGSTSTGLTVGVHVSQSATLNPAGLAESTLRDTTVALPEGVGLNPAGADGLEACSEGQIGFTGVEPGSGTDLFTAGMPEPFCPDASKIATVAIRTPLLPHALEGAVYLAAQNANPFDSLVAMYIVAQDPFSGVLVKLPGVVRLDERTGRIVATFENTPELPFEELELHFFGGERAPLGTPALCGAYKTEAAFTPWSGNETVHPSSVFQVTSGPSGKSCSDPLPFAPSLTAGTTSIQAGGFSPFTMTMGRDDGNQNLQAVQLHMPPGMSGTLSTVKLCAEEQANAGTCGPESQIGETIVSVGLGGDPFSVTGGKVYITGPYRGAPFGLSIVNPAKAGPFDLGNVVVRARIEVDPETAVLTITTDDEGPYKIPTIIDGIPLQIKHVNVNINRPGFTFNATNCSPLAITGTLRSAEGATSSLSVPYQVTNCAVLAFKPKLTASTSGRTSRAKGASLTVKLGYPAGPYDANIARVKVELPKALPSRLTTLQKACTAAVFDANPANCPAASIIGHATATTPVLPVPLTGPAIFVSHGNESFPSLVIVLQGYGVTVHLVGSTFISRSGITSSTFKTVPDVPVGGFELTLPEGPYSALAANGSLCKAKLAMPTEFVGQNGALIKTTTKIQATGCPKTKRAAHLGKTHKKRHGRKHSRAKYGPRKG